MEKKTHHIEEIYPNIIHLNNGQGRPICNTSRPDPKMTEAPAEANCRSCRKRHER